MNIKNTKIEWSEVINTQYGWSLLVICCGVALHALDTLVLATMLPSLVGDVGGIHLVAWTLALYEIGTIVVSVVAGLLSYRYGVKKFMLFTAIIFTLGCVCSAIAPTMEIVLIGRFLQGIGGGGLLAISFIASALLFPMRVNARIMGAISVFWGSAGFVGPLLGGIFVELATWRIGFCVFAVAGLALAVSVFFVIDDKRNKFNKEPTSTNYPFKRIACLVTATFLLVAANTQVNTLLFLLMSCGALASVVIFFRIDSNKSSDRMIPIGVFDKSKPVGSALIMIASFAAGSVTLSIYGAIFLTELHQASTLLAGYVIACPAIGWAAATFLVSGLPEESDSKMIASGMTLALFALTGFVYAIPIGPIWLVSIFAISEGVGFGIAWAFITRRMRFVSKPEEVSINVSAIPTVQAIGYALGALYVGCIANASGLPTAIDHATFQMSAVLVFVACIPIVLLGTFAMRKFITH